MGGALRRGLDVWNGLAPPSRRLIIGAIVIFFIGLVVLWRFSGQTSYTTLASGLDPEDTKAVTAGLDEAGIPYEITDGGTAVEVPSDMADEARVDLAGQNLLDGSSGVGYEIFDQTDLGATDFTQRVNLIRATEGELSRVISQLEPVQSATVKVAMPEERLFSDEQLPTTASVLLDLAPGATLDPAQVKGITQLVAGAVPGLEASKITISDQNGNLLDGAGDTASAVTGAQTRMAIEAEYEQRTQAKLDAMLASILGPGKAVTQVDAVLDLNKVQTEKETFGQDATPLEQEESTEDLNSQGGGAAGAAAGAAANTPGATFPATQGGGDGTTDYTKETNKVRNGVDHERQSIEATPGTLTSQSISVQVSDEIPAAQVAQIEDAVIAAVGFEQGRDQINVQAVPFAEDALASQPAAEPPPPGLPFTIWDAAKVGLLVIGLLFLLLVARKALRRRQSALERALPELLEKGPVALAELEAGPSREVAQLEGKSKTDVERQMEDLATRQPADVAQLLRGWLLEKG